MMRPAVAAIVLLSAAIGGILAGRRRRNEAAPVPPQPSATIPDVTGLIDAEVFDSFPAWVQKHEGALKTFYRDVKGLVTIGLGNLVDPIERALVLPMQREDGTPATRDEIEADWRRVKALPPALLASRYAAPGALRLSSEQIALLVRRQSALDIRRLVRDFPDLPTYPKPAQTALLGMAWALGAGFASKFPTFSAAVRRRDWPSAAENCSIRDANRSRNEAHRDLFLAAADSA